MSEDAIARLSAALEGRYRVESKLGEGGMATVYLAHDLKHERRVALKVLKPELAAVVGGGRFLAEIKTTANLQHPHILPLHDSGEADGMLFYVMPYVEGESLRERLDREHQLPVDDAVHVATKVADALHHAHRQGVIHRDIKPANVLLLDGEPVVSDFGIAVAVGAAGGGRLTETGLSLGTPHYMSPEQATGDRKVGPATDVYALGCVLYEMLVGAPPFTGSTPQAVLGKIITGERPSAKTERASVPPNVDAAIAKALEKVPADRFGSAKAFGEALHAPGFGADRVPAGTGRPGSGRATHVAVGVGAAALAAALTWWLVDAVPPPTPMRFAVPLPEGQELVEPRQLRLSSDGTMLVYTGPAEGEEEWRLWVHDVTSGIGQPISNTSEVTFFDLSPEGDELALVAGDSLRVRTLGSDQTRTLVPDGVRCCVTWGEDDRIYYAYLGDNMGVSRISPQGTDVEVLTTVEGGVGDEWPAPIPGTNLVLFERNRGSRFEPRVMVFDVDTREVREVVEGAHPKPFGDLILFTHQGSLQWVDLGGGVAPTTIASGMGEGGVVPQAEAFAAPAFDVSPSGHLVYSTGDQGQIPLGRPVWVERDGTETPIDPTEVGRFQWVRISPDSSRLALMIRSGDVAATIYTKDLPEGPLIRLTLDDEFQREPFWSRDGTAIYFTAAVPTDSVLRSEIRRIRADGAGGSEAVLSAPEAVMTPDEEWWIYRTPNFPGNPDLFAVRTTLDSDTIQLTATEASESEATISRDGRWFAYRSDVSGVPQVYVRPFPEADSGRVQITAEGGSSPRFSPATDELFVVEDGWMVAVSYSADSTFRVTGRRRLFDVSAYSISFVTHYDVTPDGRTFVMVRRLDQGGAAPPVIEFRYDYLRALQEAAGR